MLTIMNKSARLFIVSTILGIQRKSSSERNEETNISNSKVKEVIELEKYLYVGSEDEKDKDMKFTKRMRFISYFLTTAILTVFVMILFEGCILSTKSIILGKNCPDFDAHCFDTTNVIYALGPYVCTSGEKVDFNISAQYVWCVGWVINQQDINSVLEKIGICGGLLGIISCIVPFIYYISHYASNPRKGWLWIWVPLLPIIALITIGIYMRPARPSMLAVISLALIFCMALGGWIWAMFSAYRKFYKKNPCHCCRFCTYFTNYDQRGDIANLNTF